MLSSAEFVKELIKRFPAIKDDMLGEDFAFSITLHMGVLQRFIRNLHKHGILINI